MKANSHKEYALRYSGFVDCEDDKDDQKWVLHEDKKVVSVMYNQCLDYTDSYGKKYAVIFPCANYIDQ